MASLLLLIAAVLLSTCSRVSSRSVGAPTFPTVCSDMTQQHAPSSPSACGDSCPFAMSISRIDGSPVSGGQVYRCGSVHTICINATRGAQFRGVAVQSRVTTAAFSTATRQGSCGEFTNLPSGLQEWDCPGNTGVTHTDSSDKTSVCFDWIAPSSSDTPDCTLWFSITRMYSNFHSQLRGLDLTPDPGFCGAVQPTPATCGLTCEGGFTDSINQQLQFSCTLEGCSADGYTCNLDARGAEACTIPQTISLAGLSIGNHNFSITAAISGTTQSITSILQFPNNPTLECVPSANPDNTLSIECSSNFDSAEGTCSCLVDGIPLEPCDPYGGIDIDPRDYEIGNHAVEVTCTHTASGISAPQARFSFTAPPTRPPTQAPLILNCSGTQLPESEQISVSCSSSRDLASLTFTCSQNGVDFTEGCGQFPLLLSYTGQSGEQSVVISASGSDGARVTSTLRFTIQTPPTRPPTQAPLILNCSGTQLPASEQISVSCSSSRDIASLTFECSMNGVTFTEGCGEFPLLRSYAGLSGEQTIVLSASGSDGASVTATLRFTIQTPPTRPPTQAPLTLDCNGTLLSASEQISVSCSSSRDIASLTFVCSMNGMAFTEGCGEFPLLRSYAGLSGEQTIVLSASGSDGASVTSTLRFTIQTPPTRPPTQAPLTLDCNGTLLSASEQISVSCSSSRDIASLTFVCSMNGMAFTEGCGEFPLLRSYAGLSGEQTIVLSASGSDGASVTATLRFTIQTPPTRPPTQAPLTLDCNGTLLSASEQISVSCSSSRDIASLTFVCSMNGMAFTEGCGEFPLLRSYAGLSGEQTIVLSASGSDGASVTATLRFTIQTPPTRPPTQAPLTLDCNGTLLSASEQISVSCSSSRDIALLTFVCSMNGMAFTEGCGEFPLLRSYAGLSGEQTIVLSASGSDGASVTATLRFTIQTPPTRPPTQAPLTLDCNGTLLSASEQISVSCSSSRDIASLTFVCSMNGMAFTERCGEFPLLRSYAGLSGEQTIVLSASGSDGASVTSTLHFTIQTPPTQPPTQAPPILDCNGTLLPESEQISISCPSIQDIASLTFVCSMNGVAFTEGCGEFPLLRSYAGLSGEQTIVISASGSDGASVTATLRFTIQTPPTRPPTQAPLTLDCNGTLLSASEQISVSCSSSRDIALLTFVCSMNGMAFTEGCGEFPLLRSYAGLSGEQTIVLSASGSDGASVTATLRFTIQTPPTRPPTQAPLTLDCNGTLLSASEQISVSCSSSRDIASLTFVCSMNGMAFTEGCGEFPLLRSYAGLSGEQTIVLSASGSDGASVSSTLRFTIQTPPTRPPTQAPLTLDCNGTLLSASEQISVSCSSSRDIASLTFVCSMNGMAFTEGCGEFPLLRSYAGLSGEQTIVLSASGSDGASVTTTLRFTIQTPPTQPPTLPPLSLSCTAELLGSELIVSCSSSREISTLRFVCSQDGVTFSEGCGEFPYITSVEGQVGSHTVTFNATGADGVSTSVTVQYSILASLACFEIADTILLRFSCSGVPNAAIHNATCIYDDGRPAESCDVNNLVIDQFSFSAGSHVLTIQFFDAFGNPGQFEYPFQGAERQRVRIGLVNTEYSVDEGSDLIVQIEQLQGILFGPVQVNVTPIACSDFEGDLSTLFANIPTDSADPGTDLKDATRQVARVYPGSFALPPTDAVFSVAIDDLIENEECLLLELSIDEANLHERDVGVVELVSSVAIARIQDTTPVTTAAPTTPAPGFEVVCGISGSGLLNIGCSATGGEVQTVVCSYDNGAIVENCSLSFVIDFERFVPGEHTLIVTATTADGQSSSSAPISFTVPPRLEIECLRGGVSGRVTFNCNVNNALSQPLECLVLSTLTPAVAVECVVDESFNVGVPNFTPGVDYVLAVSSIDVFGQLGTFEQSFVITEPLLTFFCELLPDQSALSCSSSLDDLVDLSYNCTLNDEPIECGSGPTFDLPTGLEPGLHSYVIDVESPEGQTASFEYMFVVPEPATTPPTTTQPPPGFELFCGSSSVSGSGPVSVECSATGGVVQTVVCNYDNGAIIEDCSLNFAISFERFGPGEHTLVVTATTADGSSSSVSIFFTVPPPLEIVCVGGGVPGRVTFNCSASNPLFQPLSCSVSSGSGTPVDVQCMVGEAFSIGIPDFTPGVIYNLVVSGIDVFEQVASFEQSFVLNEPLLTFFCELAPDESALSCSSSLDDLVDLSYNCTLNDEPIECGSGPTFDLPTGLEPGLHSYVIDVESPEGQTASFEYMFVVPEPATIPPTTQPPPGFELFCGSSSVSGSGPVSVECSATGGVVQTVVCNYDNGAIIEDCSLNFAISFERFGPGEHTLVVTATAADGSSSSARIPFTVPPPLEIVCVGGGVPGRVTFNCSASNALFQPLSCSVSSGSGAPVDVQCMVGEAFSIGIPDFTPGMDYNLVVSGIDVFEQTASFEQSFVLNEPLLTFFCELAPDESALSCSSSLDDILDLSYNCTLNDEPIECGSGPTFDLPTGLEPGLHSYVIDVESPEGQAASFEYVFIVPEPQTTPPTTTQPPSGFELLCGFSSVSGSGPVNVECSATGGVVQTVVCNYDNGAIVEDCSLNFAIGFERFGPGEHTLVITATTADGRSSSLDPFSFNVPPPLEIVCVGGGVPGRVTFNCSASNALFQPLSCSVSSGSGAPVDVQCMVGEAFSIGVPDFPPGMDYNLVVRGTDVFEQVASFEQSFVLSEPLLTFFCELAPDESALLCSSSLDNIVDLSYNCTLNDQPIECGSGPTFDLPTGLEPGLHSYVIDVESPEGQADSFEYMFIVPEPPTTPPTTTQPPSGFELLCGFSSVSGSGPVSVDCSATGGVVQTVVCNYDNGAIVEDCSLNFAIGFERFGPGKHTLVITATAADGSSSSTPFSFTVPPPLEIVCGGRGVSGRVTFNCSASNALFQPLSCSVSSGSGAPVDVQCMVGEPFSIRIPDFTPGLNYTLVVSGIDVFEQGALFRQSFVLGEPLLVFSCDFFPDESALACSSSLDDIVELSYDCSLNNQPVDCGPGPNFTLPTELAPGSYIYLVNIRSPGGQSSSSLISFTVGGFELECGLSSVSPSGPVSVDCSASGGAVLAVLCNYDNGTIVENCSLSFEIDFGRFGPGVHSLTITAMAADGQLFSLAPLTFVVPPSETTTPPPVTPTIGPVCDLQCAPLLGPRLPILSCFLFGGNGSAVCEYDDGRPSEPCDPSFLEIDRFSFSPGPHQLTIRYSCDAGGSGVFVFDFQGETRDRIDIRIELAESSVTEGSRLSFDIRATGFSYGSIPITATPLGCSDYPGNLGDRFTVIPPNSASPAEDLISSDPRVVNIDLAFFPRFGSVSFVAQTDDLDEGEECLVVVLSVNETQLDPRDRGQVDFSEGVALVTIDDSSVIPGGLTCLDFPDPFSSNRLNLRCFGLVQNASCMFDDGQPLRPCDVSSISFDTFSFSPGPHVLFISYVDFFGSMQTFEFRFTGQIRPRAVVGFQSSAFEPGPADLGSVFEGGAALLNLEGSGFSYGSIPLQVTPLPCSDYLGNLSALFDNVPAASASLADLADRDTMTRNVVLGRVFPGVSSLQYGLAVDDAIEGTECLLFTLSVDETQLDPLDQGQVDISNSLALLRISDLNDIRLPPGQVIRCMQFPENGRSDRVLVACAGSIQSANCSYDDGRPPIVPCDISLNSIDTFDFSPGPHTFTINYIDINGNRGMLEQPFMGQARPGAAISLVGAIDVVEGGQLLLTISGDGFSYGDIPVRVAPLPCSDYSGNLSALFPGDIPAASASAADLVDSTPVTVNLDLGQLLPAVSVVHFAVVADNVVEGDECLLLEVSVDEAQLDPRDRGMVNISSSLSLIRISDASAIPLPPVSPVTSTPPPQVCEIQCFPLLGSRLTALSCLSFSSNGTSAVCEYDDGRPTESCDVSFIEIDQFSFSPGPHQLTIRYSCDAGGLGVFVYDFEGETRDRIEISIQPTELTVTEGDVAEFNVQATGFSYGNIPITATPFACSDFDLGDLFSEIPANSSDPADDLVNSDAQVLNIDLAFFPPFGSVSFTPSRDDLDEGDECLAVVLSVNETQLDPRDRGQVDFSSRVALLTIEDLERPTVECSELADGALNLVVLSCFGSIQSANCSFDDGRPPLVPCDISSISFDIFTFSPGPHTFTIDYIDNSGNPGVFEYQFTGQVRPRAVVGLGPNGTDFGTVIEGVPIFFTVSGIGFSYGIVPVRVTPLPCSDYPGDLTALFSNVPAASASAADLDRFTPVVANLSVGSFFPDIFAYVYTPIADDLLEGEECLIFNVSVDEAQLDSRDRGMVDIQGGVALVRIQDLIVITLPPQPVIDCIEIADAGGFNEIFLTCFGFVQSTNCSYDDGRPPIVPCNISSITIDTFDFSPGPHTFSINYIDNSGNAGVFEYQFTGRVRPRAVVGFGSNNTDFGTVTEGNPVVFSVDGTGFSYGNVPARVTPLPCSDYPGDLTALFSDVPAASASAADLVSSEPVTANLLLGRFIPGFTFFSFEFVSDDLDEGEECLVLVVSVNETQLDSRDRGQVDVSNGVALVRIVDEEIVTTTPPPVTLPPPAVLRCVEIADGGGLFGIAFSCFGENAPVRSANCSYDDGSPPLVPCDLDFVLIDFFNFSPEPHVLRIDFIDDNGNAGVFEYEFSGRVRPRAVIDFDMDNVDLGTVVEGQDTDLSVDGTGFSYGNIPVQITPLPCSDYPGDLTALFSDVPAASASADDLLNGEALTFDLALGSPFRPGAIRLLYLVALDLFDEGEECLVFTLSINETALDPRDQGQVDLARDVALLRIQDPVLMCTQAPSFASILVDCDANFPFSTVNCSFDGGRPEPCTLPLVIDQLDYSVGLHSLTIMTGFPPASDVLEFTGVTVASLPRIFINFHLEGEPGNRVLGVTESEEPAQSLEVTVEGTTFSPLPFSVLYLGYDELAGSAPGRDLDAIFPSRPSPAVAVDDFNTTDDTQLAPGLVQPVVIDDSEVELPEGFLALLQLETTDQRDLQRIRYLNDIVLVTIEDDDTIECSSNVVDDTATVSCGDLDGQPDNGDIFCSVDSGPSEACNFPYSVPVPQLSTGGHQVRIFRQVAGQQMLIGGSTFEVEPLDVYFYNNTPVLNVDMLFAQFRANRPNITFECHLTHHDVRREDCSSGVFERSGLPHGDYTLRVIARDLARPQDGRIVIRNRIWVHGDNIFCITGTQNRGLTISGNNATVEFYSTGVVTSYKCVLDRMEIIENCVSPYTIENLPLGRHHFKVIPNGCGRLYRSNTMQFTIV